MNRRDCLKALAVLTGGCATRSLNGLIRDTINYMPGKESLSTLAEFSNVYRDQYMPTQQDTITVLYPGSGFDISPLEIGFQLLHKSKVKETRFIYTEIGEYEQELPTWHEGLKDLDQRIRGRLSELGAAALVNTVQAGFKESNWRRKNIPNSQVIEYEMNVPIGDERKKIIITLGYNTFEQRTEPTETEQRNLPPEILRDARKNYWPTPAQPGKIYPTYFLQEQFDAADILLSKQCGDFGLLQFDYMRAWNKTPERKPRVLLTEYAEELGPFRASLTGYGTKVHLLENNTYGYCAAYQQSCKVGILGVQPK